MVATGQPGQRDDEGEDRQRRVELVVLEVEVLHTRDVEAPPSG